MRHQLSTRMSELSQLFIGHCGAFNTMTPSIELMFLLQYRHFVQPKRGGLRSTAQQANSDALCFSSAPGGEPKFCSQSARLNDHQRSKKRARERIGCCTGFEICGAPRAGPLRCGVVVLCLAEFVSFQPPNVQKSVSVLFLPPSLASAACSLLSVNYLSFSFSFLPPPLPPRHRLP
jgi:hypothetical protein